MNLELKKEVGIEYIENIYALASNYLKRNNNLELKYLLNELELIEDTLRACDNVVSLKKYKIILEHLINKIEVIINE